MISRVTFLLLLVGLSFVACETEFIPEDADLASEIVVEGYIEAGDEALPPLILLTNTVPFFSSFDPDQIDDLFVHDALVEVNDGNSTFTLEEFCVEDIPEPLRVAVLGLLGIEVLPDEPLPNLCAYVDTTGSLQGEVGKTYNLSIEVAGQKITASTKISASVAPYNNCFLYTYSASAEEERALVRC